MARPGDARRVWARLGGAWLGEAWHGKSRYIKVICNKYYSGMAAPVASGLGALGNGWAGRSEATQYKEHIK